MTADREDAAITDGAAGWVGRSIPRFEDAALLTGRGRYLDDLGTRPGTFEATILRSPHAHAEIEAIDCEAARTADGVAAVLTGADVIAGGRREGAARVLADRGRSCALCR